jgi:hypothetical protein
LRSSPRSTRDTVEASTPARSATSFRTAARDSDLELPNTLVADFPRRIDPSELTTRRTIGALDGACS